jgi:hypothetical protein
MGLTTPLGGCVDRLPARLWAPGNLHVVLRARATVHFCLGGTLARTVEVNGHEVLRGRPGGARDLAH